MGRSTTVSLHSDAQVIQQGISDKLALALMFIGQFVGGFVLAFGMLFKRAVSGSRPITPAASLQFAAISWHLFFLRSFRFWSWAVLWYCWRKSGSLT